MYREKTFYINVFHLNCVDGMTSNVIMLHLNVQCNVYDIDVNERPHQSHYFPSLNINKVFILFAK